MLRNIFKKKENKYSLFIVDCYKHSLFVVLKFKSNINGYLLIIRFIFIHQSFSNLANTNQNLSNIDNALVSVSKVTNRASELMPDNTDYNGILQPGWYDIYSTDISKSHAPASGLGRVLLRVESILLGGSTWITTQEAIEWYGVISLSNPRTWKRWTYSQNGVLVWVNWKEL